MKVEDTRAELPHEYAYKSQLVEWILSEKELPSDPKVVKQKFGEEINSKHLMEFRAIAKESKAITSDLSHVLPEEKQHA